MGARGEDLTFDKTDEKDAVLIARLAGQLRRYVPEPVDEIWGRLRHLGARRAQLLADAGSQVQEMRALSGRVTVADTELGLLLYGLTGGR